jgi:ammonium transporter, Amt family
MVRNTASTRCGSCAWARSLLAALPLLLAGTPALAEETARRVDTGDTAWMLTSTVLVLLMTVPGLALFYGGMVRKKNVLAIMMQSFSICAAVTVTWIVLGYSLAFGNGGAYIGDLSRVFLAGIGETWDKPFTLGASTANPTPMTIPETAFIMYQMSFAIITPAVVTGAFADRMRFSALMLLMVLWSLAVYAPIAHWAWSARGWLNALGLADFAGGTVVEINSGVSGLVCALVLGQRLGYGHDNMAPYNLVYAVIGACLLWVGWLGFNSGSAGGANAHAAMAVLVTQIAAAGAALGWMFAEWISRGKPTVLGAISGAVAGLVAITPAAGFVLPGPALFIGLLAGVLCLWAVTALKPRLGYDDSLDAFGVHGVGGALGTLLTGLFAFGPLSGTADHPEGLYVGGAHQLLAQVWGVLATLCYSGAVTYVLLKAVDASVGLRVTREQERQGLDEVLHGESLG